MDPLAHASVGLLVKPFAPKAPLWALVAATQVPDILSFAFMAIGAEYGATTKVDFEHGLQYLSSSFIPWSHGLLMSIFWTLIVTGIAYLLFREKRASVIIGIMVFGHWALDFTVYKYIPVFFDNSLLTGLGLITTPPGFIAGILFEIILISGGIITYLMTKKRSVPKKIA